jgi:hypothetical protein
MIKKSGNTICQWSLALLEEKIGNTSLHTIDKSSCIKSAVILIIPSDSCMID